MPWNDGMLLYSPQDISHHGTQRLCLQATVVAYMYLMHCTYDRWIPDQRYIFPENVTKLHSHQV